MAIKKTVVQPSKPEEQVIYETTILRKDGQFLTAIQSSSFEECYQKWEQLHAQWTECVKEVKPFIIKDPVVTAFEPGLIYEIILQPIMKSPANSVMNENNPYARNMLERGFSSTFGNQDLLSRASNPQY